MSVPTVDVEVRHEPEQHRYVARVDGEHAGLSNYVRRDDVVVFVHTETDERWAGQGVGSALVRGALDDVRAQGLGVVARCPFVAAWIERHPAYADLLVAEA